MTTCIRCDKVEATGVCCSAHSKQLCHACYRRTHFVEICAPGCSACAREGIVQPQGRGGVIARPVRDAESTSATLRRVEQERDEALADRDHADEVRREADRDGWEIAKKLDLAQSELASARTELDAVRAARDTLDRELSEVRAEADEKVRAVLAADYRPAAVVHAYDALYCRTCYARFLPDTPAAETHPHPLVAVRVSITSRTEEHETA